MCIRTSKKKDPLRGDELRCRSSPFFAHLGLLGQLKRLGGMSGCSQKTCHTPSSFISGPPNFRESRRCCSKEAASLSFAKYLNCIYCAGEGAALTRRNCRASHFDPDRQHSPSSPVMGTFLSFKEPHKRHLQSIHSLISARDTFPFTGQVIHFYRACVYLDPPPHRTTTRFPSQALRATQRF